MYLAVGKLGIRGMTVDLKSAMRPSAHTIGYIGALQWRSQQVVTKALKFERTDIMSIYAVVDITSLSVNAGVLSGEHCECL